jgi:hypothetical protein
MENAHLTVVQMVMAAMENVHLVVASRGSGLEGRVLARSYARPA